MNSAQDINTLPVQVIKGGDMLVTARYVIDPEVFLCFDSSTNDVMGGMEQVTLLVLNMFDIPPEHRRFWMMDQDGKLHTRVVPIRGDLMACAHVPREGNGTDP